MNSKRRLLSRSVAGIVLALFAQLLWAAPNAHAQIEVPASDLQPDGEAQTDDGTHTDDEVQIQIVGGSEADPGEYPFMTALFLDDDQGSPRFNCGATLVSPTWVLTAAHCVRRINSPSEITLLVGASNRRGLDGEIRAAQQVVMHPKWDNAELGNDIALVELDEPANAPVVGLASATTSDLWLDAETAIAAGWGDTETSLGFPSQIHDVELPVLTDGACQSTRIGHLIEPDIMLCAGETGRDACDGDSGGPLLAASAFGFIQIGVTSFGIGCADTGFPGVYTEVAAYEDWVSTVIAESLGQPVEVSHVVTCLAENGRIDTNIVNTGTSTAIYRVEFGNLSQREWTVAPGDWWRSPITGRPDGGHEIVVRRDGQTISRTFVRVECDTDTPITDPDEVAVINSCRGGNGYLLFQFANPTDQDRAYLIEFERVPNRSTTAAAHGASVRAVTGRGDGTWDATISSDGETISTLSITVDCDA